MHNTKCLRNSTQLIFFLFLLTSVEMAISSDFFIFIFGQVQFGIFLITLKLIWRWCSLRT